MGVLYLKAIVSCLVALFIFPVEVLADGNGSSCSEDETATRQLEEYLESYGKYPEELSEFSGLSRQLQKIAFARLLPQEKTQLWLDNVALFEKSEELSDRQLEYLRLLRQALVPGVYAGLLDQEERETLSELSIVGRLLFTPEQMSSMAYRLGRGRDDSGAGFLLEKFDAVRPDEGSGKTLEKTDEPNCSCNTYYHDECESITLCRSHQRRYTFCKPTSVGCGFLWLEECDGECCFYLAGQWWC